MEIHLYFGRKGSQPLYLIFPRLFRIAENKDLKVAEMRFWRHNTWNSSSNWCSPLSYKLESPLINTVLQILLVFTLHFSCECCGRQCVIVYSSLIVSQIWSGFAHLCQFAYKKIKLLETSMDKKCIFGYKTYLHNVMIMGMQM